MDRILQTWNFVKNVSYSISTLRYSYLHKLQVLLKDKLSQKHLKYTIELWQLRSSAGPVLKDHPVIIVVVVQSLNRAQHFANPWTIACQAPLSMGFPRKEYWSGLPFPSRGDLPNPEIKPVSPALAGGFFTTESPGKPIVRSIEVNMFVCFLLNTLNLLGRTKTICCLPGSILVTGYWR